MRRLYLRFYLALLASLLLFAAVATSVLHRTGGPADQAFKIVPRLLQNALPDAHAPQAEQQAALSRLVAGIDANVALYSADQQLIASVGAPPLLSATAVNRRRPGALTFTLPDGRLLVGGTSLNLSGPIHITFLMLATLALVVGIVALPIVRHISGRLERLQQGVDRLGAGELSTRVAVEGRDEVAQLAQSFNQAAARIEALVMAHKSLLANASHELRTPLARIRLAIELMGESVDAKRRAGLSLDIAELDQLVDEILLASRLDALRDDTAHEPVDLLALAAEEAARYDTVQLDGQTVIVKGDARLLRRLIRNLLENAHRHGKPPVALQVRRLASSAELQISDAGPGVAAEDAERLFEPFHRPAHSRESTGAGLGLALVRQIARRHGGDARCVNEGTGPTRFVITLPI